MLEVTKYIQGWVCFSLILAVNMVKVSTILKFLKEFIPDVIFIAVSLTFCETEKYTLYQGV